MQELKLKLSEENTRVNLHDLELSNDFLDMTPKAKVTTKGSSQKFKTYTLKDTINKMKKKPREWKIYINIKYV